MSTPYSIRSLQGGLNTRDLPSALAADECPVLENYYTDGNNLLTKRGGMQMLQYAPVNPTVFTADANTMALWHFDAVSGGKWLDSSGNGNSLSNFATGSISVAVPSLFTNGVFTALPSQTNDGNCLAYNGAGSPAKFLDGLNALTIECWINLTAGINGGNITVVRNGNSYTFPVSNGAALFRTTSGLNILFNGIYYQNEVNPLTGNIEPYLQAIFFTNGIPGTETTLNTNALPTNTWLHVRFTYSGATGLMQFFVNANLESQAYANGGGTINDSVSTDFAVGGEPELGYFPFSELTTTFPGIIDEMMISNVVRTTFPFYQLRGKGFEFWQSNGTHQFVVSAQDGLFFGTGSGGWTRMVNTPNNNSTFQYNAANPSYWDAFQLNDFLYLSDGINTPQCWDGQTLCDWGNPSVPLNLSLIAGVTGPAAGTTKMVYTYLYGNYETGISPIASIPNPSGYQVNVANIPWRHSNATGIRIYVQAQGSATWYLWRQLGNTSGAYQNVSGVYVPGSPASYLADGGAYGVADNQLGTTDYPQISANAATAVTFKWKYLVVQGRRMLVCGQPNEPYNARWSELDTPDVFEVYNFTVGNSGSGPLNGMGLWYGDTVFSKSGSAMLVLRGTDPNSWDEFELLHPTVGCLDHWAFVHHFPTIPPGQDQTASESSDRYVLAFPGPDGFYAYEGQDLRKISDKINPTYAGIAQQTTNKSDWIIDTEAGFESNLAQGGSATANVQQATYASDGIRQVNGQLGPFNQLDYLGLWQSNRAAPAGNVIAICKGVGADEYWFSTDGDNNLWHTTDNYATMTVATTLANKYEHIIEIVKQGAADLYYLFTDQNANQVLRATVNGSGVVGTGLAINVPVSTTAGFYPGQFLDFTSVGHVIPELVAGIQIPEMILRWNNNGGYPVTGNFISVVAPVQNPTNANPVGSNYITLFIPNGLSLPLGTEIYQSKAMTPDSFGGNLYTFNNVGQILSAALSQELYYSADNPIQVNSSAPSSGNPSWNVRTITGFADKTSSNETTGIGPNFGNTPAPLYLNHRQNIGITIGGFSVTTSLHPIAITLFETSSETQALTGNLEYVLDTQVETFGINITNAPSGYLGGILQYVQGNLSSIMQNILPGFYALQSYQNIIIEENPGDFDGPRNVALAVSATRREFPAWLGGTFRPQAFWDAVNSQLVFLASNPADGDGNCTSQLRSYNGAVTTHASVPISAIATDGTNLYLSYELPIAAFVNQNSGLWIQKLNNLGVPVAGLNITANSIITRLFHDPISKRLMWFEKTFNYKNWCTYFSEAYAIAASITGAYVDLLTLAEAQGESPSSGTGGGPVLQEAADQTDAPNVWIVAVNKITSTALYKVDSTLALATDVSTLASTPYVDVPSTETAAGISSNLLFVASSASWADRIYFGAQGVGVAVQLGLPGNWTITGQYIGPYNNLGAFAAFDTVTTDESGTYALYLRNSSTVAGLAGNELQVSNGIPINSNLFDPPGIYTQWRIVWTWAYSLAVPTEPPFLTFVDVGYFVGALINLPRITGYNYLGRSYWSVAVGQQEENNLVIVWQKTRTWMLIKGWNLAGISTFQGYLVALMQYGWVRLESGGDDLGALIVGKARTSTFLGPVFIGVNEQPAYAQIAHLMGQLDKLVSQMQANLQSFVNDSIANQNAWLIITPYAGETPLPNSAWALPVPASNQVQTMRVAAQPYAEFGYDWARSFSLMIETSQDTAGPYIQLVDVPEVVQTIDIELDMTEPTYDLTVQ